MDCDYLGGFLDDVENGFLLYNYADEWEHRFWANLAS